MATTRKRTPKDGLHRSGRYARDVLQADLPRDHVEKSIVKPVFIMAKDNQSALGIAWRIGLHRGDWTYLERPEDLCGRERPTVFRSYNWCDHPHSDYIMGILTSQQAWIWTESTR